MPPRKPASPPTLKQRIRRFIKRVREEIRHARRKLTLPVIFLSIAVVLWFFLSMPSLDDIDVKKKTPAVQMVSQTGQVVGSYGGVHGAFLKKDQFPKSLVDAVLATEDRNFYYHPGIDPVGITRAMVANLRAGKTVQGGSTITQQAAKNLFLTPDRTWLRKLRELVMAMRLEVHYSKDEILALYLNRVYLGAGNFGVDAASQRYFDKSAKELTLSESAILAGLLKAPSRFSPIANPELARKRAEQVLLNMVDAGYLKPEQAEKAKTQLAQTVQRTVKSTSEASYYFTDWIMEQLGEYLQGTQEDLVVTVTMDPTWQRIAETSLQTALKERGEKLRVTQGAIVAMAPDGAVRVMVGGKDYTESQFNRAYQAQRQPGSSFKPFVYLTGLEHGMTPGTVLYDAPITVGKWSPKNYDGEFRGEITIAEAVARSVNTIAVQVSEMSGRENVVEMAHRLGIESELLAAPSIALGSVEVNLLELTTAYAHLASGGWSVKPYGITRIATAKGKTLYQRGNQQQEQVLTSNTVAMMNYLLNGVMTYGTGTGAAIGRPAAGKTGTTSDYRDAWFMGYTPELVTGVWVGNDDNKPMKRVTGGTLPAPIWRSFMSQALAGEKASALPMTTEGESALPWRSSRSDFEQRPAPDDSGEINLGTGFWDKLYGGPPPEDEAPQEAPEDEAPPAPVYYY